MIRQIADRMIERGMDKKLIALVGAAGIAAGWLMGSSVSQSPSPSASAPSGAQVRRGPHALGTAPREPVAPFTEQLRLKLQEQPRSPSPGRNPFVFGSRRAAPSMAPRRTRDEAPEVSAAPESTPLSAPKPRFDLTGMASNQKDGVTTWTAIIVGSNGLSFVTAGDKLSGGYLVTKVEEKSVTIMDPTGVEQILKLK